MVEGIVEIQAQSSHRTGERLIATLYYFFPHLLVFPFDIVRTTEKQG
jgi:hypothetical protein